MTLSKVSVSLLLSCIASVIPTISIPLPDGTLACFAKLGRDASDRRTDVVIYNNNDEMKKVIALKQVKSDKNPDFEEYASFETEKEIVSISALDMNKDGVTDLFVITKTNVEEYQLNVYYDTESRDKTQRFSKQSGAAAITLSDPTVLIFDANGDFIPDVFGKAKDENQETFWFGRKGDDDRYRLDANVTSKPLGIDQGKIDMNTVSLADLDGDCKADLIYVAEEENDRKAKMIKGRNFASDGEAEVKQLFSMLPGDQSLLYFADVNKDGAMDIINPTKNATIHLYVQQKNIPFKQLCSGKPLEDIKWTNCSGDGHAECSYDAELNLLGDYAGYELGDGLPIIVQDINMDSQINFVAILQSESGHSRRVFVTALTDNDDKLRNIDDIAAKFQSISTSKNIQDVAFFHSGEYPLGVYLLIQFDDNSFDWINLKEIFKKNNYGFLSVGALNDAGKPRQGGALPGVTVTAFFHSKSGKQIFLTAGTLYQTNSRNHYLPFIPFGLNVPENYIEKLWIGYCLYDQKHTFSQPGLPPNSELVLYAEPRDNPSQWKLETFLAPYLDVPTLTIIIAVVMSVLGGLWLYLEIQEKQANKNEKLKTGSATNNFFF